MKIVARPDVVPPPFKDYYDNLARALGETPVYHRDQKFVMLPARQYSATVAVALMHSHLARWSQETPRMGVLCVAGQLYPYLHTLVEITARGAEYNYQFVAVGSAETEVFAVLKRIADTDIRPKLADALIWDWRVYKDTVWSNVCLRKYNFQRILPPRQAAQVLDSYLANQATTPELTPPPMLEKVAVATKDFDKWSLRKQSGQSK